MGTGTAPGFRGRLRTCVAALGTGALLISLAHSAPLAVANPSAVGPVLHWNAVLGDAAIAACLAPTASPLAEARLYAMTHIAIHDALNAIDPRFASYSADLFAPPRTSVDAAVAAASRTVMMSVFSGLRDSITTPCGATGAALVEREYVTAMARIPAGSAREDGLAIGRRAAVAVIENRREDGATDPLGRPGSQGLAKPFGSTPATPIPYPAASGELSWLESGPATWNRLARTTAVGRQLDLWQQARYLALLNIAQADGYSSAVAGNDAPSARQGEPNAPSGGDSASTPLMGPIRAPVHSRSGRLLP